MKTRAFLLLALTLAFPALTAAAQPADEASVPRMSLADFKKALDAGQILVLDVRDAQSYANGHVPGAISVPLADLEKRAPELKASKKPIVAYCA
jgi:3-mercaptopyruvate sulfurtransferase SseA